MRFYFNAVLLVASCIPIVDAFVSIQPRRAVLPFSVLRGVSEESSTEVKDLVAESAMPVADPYMQFGISPDALASGVDPKELVRWAGTCVSTSDSHFDLFFEFRLKSCFLASSLIFLQEADTCREVAEARA